MKILFSNYLLTAIRHLRRSPLHATVTILGLSIGLAAVLLITVYIRTEANYDHFHEHGSRIYRVSSRTFHSGKLESNNDYQMIAPVGPALKAELPEIEAYTCFSTSRGVAMRNAPNDPISLPVVRYVDTSFLRIFSFEILEGDLLTALAAPFSIVLTQKTSQLYFGEENPIGKMLNTPKGDTYTVTGLVKNPPEYTDFGFDALISMSTRYTIESPQLFGWNGGYQFTTFVLLGQGTSKELVEAKFPELLWRYVNNNLDAKGEKMELFLQPLKELHLYHNDEESLILRIYFYLFGVAALIILLIACVNFVNLMLARTVGYEREVGLRKVMGDRKKGIVALFLTESFLSCLFAFMGAILLCWFALPIYTQMTGKVIATDFIWNGASIFITLLILLLTGFGTGLYPSLYLSSFEPSALRSIHGKNRLRNALIVFQFTMSMVLISTTILISRQLNYYQQKTLGFRKEQIVTFSGPNMSLLEKALQSHSFVQKTALSTSLPGIWQTSNGYRIEGVENSRLVKVFEAGADYVSLYGLELVKGESFTGDTVVDKHRVLVNEAFVRTYNWDEPIGKRVWREREFTVTGVLRDFHVESLHQKIEPLIVACHAYYTNYPYLSLHYQTEELQGMLQTIKTEWLRINPEVPFTYSFLDEAIRKEYNREREFRLAFFCFALLAILLSVLGVYSLMTYITSKRSKEVGIRKVMGAGAWQIVWLLSKTFFRLVLIASLIAIPIAWTAAYYLLQLFAYHVPIGVIMFAVSVFTAFAVAALAMYHEAMRAVMANPVDSIKLE